MRKDPPQRPAKSKRPLPALGWREWLALPGLGVGAIKAKLDTGARTSSLHAWNLEVRKLRGRAMVQFDIHPMQRSTGETVRAKAPLLEYRNVRSSSGKSEKRPVIVTPVEIAGQRFDIEITLSGRDEMGFRMLLGREALRRRFLVDPGRSFLAGRPRKKREPA